jgi:hypothetical protein
MLPSTLPALFIEKVRALAASLTATYLATKAAI